MTADGHYYVLEDNTIKASPQEWATVAVNAYEKHKADRIVAETNNGGDLVIHLLQQVKPTVATKKVTATRGKQLRAEPIAALYEQGRVHHVGYFGDLEDQMCEYEPGVTTDSPDRMDALVWALTELSEGSAAINFLSSLAVFCPNCKMPAPKQSKTCPRCNTLIGETIDSAITKSNT
jgi:phage terminase large subunit-like protein